MAACGVRFPTHPQGKQWCFPHMKKGPGAYCVGDWRRCRSRPRRESLKGETRDGFYQVFVGE